MSQRHDSDSPARARIGPRFAVLIRVSTDRQADEGESLLTQTTDARADIERLGGTIVEWYGGQEHATPGYEKKEVDRLIGEAGQGRWDAVYVNHTDRWSRDNRKSDEGLDAFRAHRVRFFVRTDEYDLYDEDDEFRLTIDVAIARRNAKVQNRKSLRNRIHRARRGLPTAGRQPYGRIFDRKTEQWGIDAEKQQLIQEIAKRYLQGEGLPALAQEYGWHLGNLRETLRDRCGDTWHLHFRSPSLNIDETVSVAVPRLLDALTVERIKDRLQANRTNLKGHPTNAYLLGGRVFCTACDRCLSGQVNNNGTRDYRYYRHGRDAAAKCPLRPLPMVPADRLESEVTGKLFDMLGNPAAIRRAVKDSLPACDEALKRRDRLREELDSLQQGRNRVIDHIVAGTLTREQADAKLRLLHQRETLLRQELNRLDVQLANVPTEDELHCVVERIESAYGPLIIVRDRDNDDIYVGGNDVASFLAMTPDDRQRLIEAVFAGVLVDGRPAGVYVTPNGTRQRSKKWDFTIRGQLDFESVLATVGH
jgi:DNA invertase Pin-like site-specific DNA recombinase